LDIQIRSTLAGFLNRQLVQRLRYFEKMFDRKIKTVIYMLYAKVAFFSCIIFRNLTNLFNKNKKTKINNK